MTTPSDPELQTAKERLTAYAEWLEEGFGVSTYAFANGMEPQKAPDLRLLLSSLDALEAENARLVDQRNCEAIRANHNEERADSAEAQRDKLATTNDELKEAVRQYAENQTNREVELAKLAGEVERLEVTQGFKSRIGMMLMLRAEQAEARLSALEGAAKPFVEFITPDPPWLSDDYPLTSGSQLARKQLLAKHFRALRAALNPTLPETTDER